MAYSSLPVSSPAPTLFSAATVIRRVDGSSHPDAARSLVTLETRILAHPHDGGRSNEMGIIREDRNARARRVEK